VAAPFANHNPVNISRSLIESYTPRPPDDDDGTDFDIEMPGSGAKPLLHLGRAFTGLSHGHPPEQSHDLPELDPAAVGCPLGLDDEYPTGTDEHMVDMAMSGHVDPVYQPPPLPTSSPPGDRVDRGPVTELWWCLPSGSVLHR
jgi:hypothetical protein